jgi:hypothetical protein
LEKPKEDPKKVPAVKHRKSILKESIPLNMINEHQKERRGSTIHQLRRLDSKDI